ncbi:MAG: hypothetical protein NXY57DRAFT_739432 [Lentinula lateritia]|nr:MAG: hypothetical protein NXY57DRAFT_739432 [Lentinula lateritia]
MAPSQKSSSTGSLRSSNVPRRPKSPVSMYQMEYNVGAPKPPRPLVRREPKVFKSSRDSTLDNHSPSVSSISSSFASSSSSFATSSTSSTKSRPSSAISFLRLFSKRKASIAPPTIFEPLGTPVQPYFRPPESEVLANTTPLGKPIQSVDEPSSVKLTDHNEILEVLRETHPGHVSSQTYSRRASLTLPPTRSHNGAPEQLPMLSHGTEYSHLPSRPNRNPKRPKTAPSSQSSRRPLPHVPMNRTPSIATFNSEVISRDSKQTTVPGPSRTENLDTRRIESPSLSLTRSKSISHSMMMVAPRPDSPFIDCHVSGPMQSYFATALGTNQSKASSNAGTNERPQGWTGEWNIDDMQDVIQKLRELR